jgi:two-component system LytT family response regulator
MHKIRAVIIDDEKLARAELARLLGLFEGVEIVAEAGNAAEGLKRLRCLDDVDVVFLDIEMPEMNGLTLAALLKDQDCQLVFCTAHDEHALKAFDLNATDYLTKPVSAERLARCLERLGSHLPARNEPPASRDMDSPLMVNSGQQARMITPSQIEKLFSVGNYVKVSGEGLDMLIQGTLAALEERLDPRYFFRANRSYIVNLKKVKNVETGLNGGYVLALQSGAEIEVSRRQSQALKNYFSL